MDAKAARAAEKAGNTGRHKRPQAPGKWWKPILVPRWLVMLAEHAAGWAFVFDKLLVPAHGLEFVLLSLLCVPIGLFLMLAD